MERQSAVFGCFVCGKLQLLEHMLKCEFCGQVVYCSEEHRTFAWPEHQPVCTALRDRKRRLTPSDSSSLTPSPATTPTIAPGPSGLSYSLMDEHSRQQSSNVSSAAALNSLFQAPGPAQQPPQQQQLAGLQSSVSSLLEQVITSGMKLDPSVIALLQQFQQQSQPLPLPLPQMVPPNSMFAPTMPSPSQLLASLPPQLQPPAPPFVAGSVPIVLQQALLQQQLQQQQLQRQQQQLLADFEQQQRLQALQLQAALAGLPKPDDKSADAALLNAQRKFLASNDSSRLSVLPQTSMPLLTPSVSNPLEQTLGIAPPLRVLGLAGAAGQATSSSSSSSLDVSALANLLLHPPQASTPSSAFSAPVLRPADANPYSQVPGNPLPDFCKRITPPAALSPKDKEIDDEIQVISPPNSSSPGVSRASRKRAQGSDQPVKQVIDHSRNILYKTTMAEHQKHLMNKGLVLNTHQSMVMRLRYIAEHVIRALNEFGWAVVDNFLGTEQCKFSYKEIERLYERGLFTAGQVADGKTRNDDHIKDIRSDYIYWFDGSDKRAEDAATVRLLISMIDSVILHFNKRIPPYTIAGRSRAMIAIYPGSGTRYVKHVDNPARDGRCITTIYYCNENWDVERDGGALRLYPETSEVPMDVDPKADRLVFFWSDKRNPHEVMPVYRHRFAITIWYMDKEERTEALEKMQKSKEGHGSTGDLDEVECKKSAGDRPCSSRSLQSTPHRKPLGQANASPRPCRVDDLAAGDSGVEDNISLLSGSAAHQECTRLTRPTVNNDLIVVEEQRSSITSDDAGDDTPPQIDVNPEYII